MTKIDWKPGMWAAVEIAEAQDSLAVIKLPNGGRDLVYLSALHPLPATVPAPPPGCVWVSIDDPGEDAVLTYVLRAGTLRMSPVLAVHRAAPDVKPQGGGGGGIDVGFHVNPAPHAAQAAAFNVGTRTAPLIHTVPAHTLPSGTQVSGEGWKPSGSSMSGSPATAPRADKTEWPASGGPAVWAVPAAAAPQPDETPDQWLSRLGSDASKWAAEFRKTATGLGYSDMDEGWLLGWFANAIMRALDEDRWRREKEPTPEPDRLAALRDAVVEAAATYHNARTGKNHTALFDAIDTMMRARAAQAPDPVTELREAAQALLDCVDGPIAKDRCVARLRAAIAAMGAKP